MSGHGVHRGTGTHGRVATRALTDVELEWIDIDTLATEALKDGVTAPEEYDTGGDNGMNE